jgi:hypothetical protein
MEFAFFLFSVTVGTILIVLALFWVAWKIYLALETNVLAEFDLWNKVPGMVRKPAFWQFAIALWILLGLRKQTR